MERVLARLAENVDEPVRLIQEIQISKHSFNTSWRAYLPQRNLLLESDTIQNLAAAIMTKIKVVAAILLALCGLARST